MYLEVLFLGIWHWSVVSYGGHADVRSNHGHTCQWHIRRLAWSNRCHFRSVLALCVACVPFLLLGLLAGGY